MRQDDGPSPRVVDSAPFICSLEFYKNLSRLPNVRAMGSVYNAPAVDASLLALLPCTKVGCVWCSELYTSAPSAPR